MKSDLIPVVIAALSCAISLPAQERPAAAPARAAGTRATLGAKSGPKLSGNYTADAAVLREAQAQALEMARALRERAANPRTQAAAEAIVEQMDRAVKLLEQAANSPEKLEAALAAEQAAYQALLRLSAREFQVSQSKSRGQGGGSGQPNQRQLDQLELKPQENRYETQRQASPQQSAEQREQLQVLNRLKELAQRQQDVNERLKELQTALQEAKSDTEREEIRRRLKRLREEEQQMLADVDELQQRMQRPENQSRMAEARQQLDKTRSEMQRAAQAMEDGAAPQALTSATRAQRDLQQLRDDFRKKSSSQFADEMRQMRSDARDLAQKQEDIGKQLDALTDTRRKALSDSEAAKAIADQLQQQKGGLTNVLEHMRNVSERAESAEPLLSKQLYDTLRKTTQDDAKNLTETRDELLRTGKLTRSVYETLQKAKEDAKSSLEVSADLLRTGFVPEADQLEARAHKTVDELKRGVERAAESVLGDETEALRLAKRELDDLTQQLEDEIARANPAGQPDQGKQATAGGDAKSGSPTNQVATANGQQEQKPSASPNQDEQGKSTQASENQAGNPETKSAQASGAQGAGQQGRSGQAQARNGQSQSGSNSPGASERPSAQNSQGAGGGQGQSNQDRERSQASSARQGSSPGNNAGASGGRGGERPAQSARRNFFDQGGADGGGGGGPHGPITGPDFGNWADRLGDVEEMLDIPELRTDVARIRDRARAIRDEFKRHSKEPQWPLVKIQLAAPLAEVRNRVAEELARRESTDSLVPIDRDPVPSKYSDLVRRYYEKLGGND